MLLVISLLYPSQEQALPWSRMIALVVFLLAALTDWLDGWLARRMGQVSDFGKFMDALADKVLTLGMFVSLLTFKDAMGMQVMKGWALFPVLLILSRELLITGLRLVAAGKGITLAAERVGKIKTVAQLVCISLYLGKMTLHDDLKGKISEHFHDPFYETISSSADAALILATLLTVVSGVVYLSKHWSLFTEKEPV